MRQAINDALSDLRAGFSMRRVWMALAHEDIGDQHRRTTFGPVWLLINYLAFTGTFVVIFGQNGSTANFPAYVAIGLLVWFYMSEVISQSVSLFEREESFIQGTTLPLTVYVMRLTMQCLIRAAYALAGCFVILFLAGTPLTASWLWSALACLLILAVTPAIIVIGAIGGAFFPDIQFIIGNVMRLGMFLTPIFWVHTGSEGLQAAFYYWNPFTYFLEIVRAPIVSGQVPLRAFAFCIVSSLLLWLAGILLLGRFRKQIVFLV